MALNEGDVLAGKYRIERLLGEGGMGAVYVATNTMLQRQVALKVMTGSFSQVPAAVERFHREAIAASRVSHPSIVQVFDAGQHEGAPWIAMELLEGESLGDRLERGPLPLDDVMTMARGALSALAEVHEQGIVHRDLKPDNIFLAKDRSGSFVPKVLDFGIAKDTSAQQLNKLTATGAVVGTAYYLSPEQAKGTADIDARADVYAMGVVLFESLSGHMPYEADTITQLIAKMFTESPRLLLDVAPHIPSPIADVVTTCLQQSREHRFGSARELLEALEGAVAVARSQGVPIAGASPVGLAHTMQGAHDPGSQPGVASPVAPPSGIGATAMGHLGGQAGSALGAPGHPASQPGHVSTPNPGHPMTGPGQSIPGLRQTAHMAPFSAPSGVAMMSGQAGAQEYASVAHAAPVERGGGGKGLLIVLVVFLFFVGAAGTGGVAWLFMAGDEPRPQAVAASEGALTRASSPPVASESSPSPLPDGVDNTDSTGQDPMAPIAPAPVEEADPVPDEPTPSARVESTRAARRRARRARAAGDQPAGDQPAGGDPAAAPDGSPTTAPEAAAPAPAPPPAPLPARPAPVRRAPRQGLSPPQIAGAVNARRPYAQDRCFERRRRRVPNLGGIVTIGWVVRPDGRADDVQVIHNGTGDEWFGRCIRNVIRSTRFPQATNGLETRARYPFRF